MRNKLTLVRWRKFCPKISNFWNFCPKKSSGLTVNYIWMYFNHPVIFSVNFRPIIFVYLSIYSLFYRFFGQIYRNSDFSLPLWSLRVCLSLFLSSCLTKKKDSWLHVVGSSLKKQRKRERREESSGQVWPKIKFIAPSSLFILRLHPLWNVWSFWDYDG